MSNPTTNDGKQPQAVAIVPLCPKCGANLKAEDVQIVLTPNPKPPEPTVMLVTSVTCVHCHVLLSIQTTLLVNPMEQPQATAKKSNLYLPS